MNRFKNRKLLALAVAVAVLIAAGVWALRGYLAHRQLAKVKAMGQQLAAAPALTAQQRRETRAAFRREVDKLTPAQRRELFAERRKSSTERLERLLKMSKREQQANLDQDIKRQEERRKEFQQSAKARGQWPGNPNAAGNQANRRLDPDQRDERARRRLDNSTPEERAARSAYFQLLSQRRQQLGLPAPGRWGWR